MSPLDRRLAVVTASAANLVNQLIELNRLRDRFRKAQLWPEDHGGSTIEKTIEKSVVFK
jgi:hypothetical protein